MEESKGKEILLDAYLKLNMVSAIIAVFFIGKGAIIGGLAAFLTCIHLSAAAVYLLDLKSLKIREILDKMTLAQPVVLEEFNRRKVDSPKFKPEV
ncbi:MAG: hypothetical protein ABEJ36_00425 [Candidatus Nanosalina sp.]